MLSQTQKDNIKDRIKEFLSDYEYEYKEEDWTLKIPISQIDYFISQYLWRSIYIESLRWNAWESDESYVCWTYYNNIIWHTVVMDEVSDDYCYFDNEDNFASRCEWIRDWIEEDKQKVTKVENAPNKIAHAIIEYLSEWGENINEKDLTELIKDYLYNNT